jgi:hypothetical protein
MLRMAAIAGVVSFTPRKKERKPETETKEMKQKISHTDGV